MDYQKVKAWQKLRDTMLLAQNTRTQRWSNVEPTLSIMSLLAGARLCERRDKHAC